MEMLVEHQALGKLLIALGVIESAELQLLSDECDTIESPDELLKLVSGMRQRLGELLCETHRITPEQLDEALAEQRRTQEKFGAVLFHAGLIDVGALEATLAF